MSSSTITSKGQITIPKQFRDQLGIEAGDEIEFGYSEYLDALIVRPQNKRVKDVAGMLATYTTKKLCIEELDQVIKNRFNDDDA